MQQVMLYSPYRTGIRYGTISMHVFHRLQTAFPNLFLFFFLSLFAPKNVRSRFLSAIWGEIPVAILYCTLIMIPGFRCLRYPLEIQKQFENLFVAI